MRQHQITGVKRLPSALAPLLAMALGAGCGSVPNSIKVYAADLPSRADGQYALLEDDSVKKQLVMKDSELQCAIDIAEGTAEEKSPACQCSHSVTDWLTDCKAWLGAHTPAPGPTGPTGPTAPTATPTPATPTPATPTRATPVIP